jgi:hypothetical protein
MAFFWAVEPEAVRLPVPQDVAAADDEPPADDDDFESLLSEPHAASEIRAVKAMPAT